MKKQIKHYFKSIKHNLPCVNSAIRKMLDDLKVSVESYIQENNITDFIQIEQHFGTAEDIAKEFAMGVDGAYIKSYKFKKRVTTIVISILAAIFVIIASLAIYIVVSSEINTVSTEDTTITYEYEEK